MPSKWETVFHQIARSHRYEALADVAPGLLDCGQIEFMQKVAKGFGEEVALRLAEDARGEALLLAGNDQNVERLRADRVKWQKGRVVKAVKRQQANERQEERREKLRGGKHDIAAQMERHT